MEHADAHTISLPVPTHALKALSILEQGDHEAWLVGGFVRDALRGQHAHDIDIATSALWEQGSALFRAAGYSVFETGIKHGTITVRIDSQTLEITTYRSESNYSDNRHPDSVTFHKSIEKDLARRDFTINAIAYHPHRGLFDPYGGHKDIEMKCIRAVGEPELRFTEDALRILRAVRFASQLGFSIDTSTAKAMQSQKALLDNIATERIAHELDRFVCGNHIHDALLENIEIIGQVIPESLPMKKLDQKTPYHIYDVLEHTAYCMQYCPPSALIRWAAFFHDIGKPASFFTDNEGTGHFYGHAKISVDIAACVMKRLRFPIAFAHKILLLVKHHDDVIDPSPRPVKRMLRKLDEDPELFRALCALKKGDAAAQAPHCYGRIELADNLEAALDQIIEMDSAFALRDLAISGKHLIALGIPPGPEIRKLLAKTLDAVIDEEIPNEQEALIAYVRSLRK